MKKCPYCAENIQDEAVYCRFCKKDLSLEYEPQAKKKRSWWYGLLFGVGGGGLTVLYRLQNYDQSNLDLYMNLAYSGFIYGTIAWTVIGLLLVGILRGGTARVLGSIGLLVIGILLYVAFPSLQQDKSARLSPTLVPRVSGKSTTVTNSSSSSNSDSQPTRVSSTTKPRPTATQSLSGIPGGMDSYITGELQASSSNTDADWTDYVAGHARNLAIPASYTWEYYGFPIDTRYAPFRDHYIEQCRDLGYQVTFNEVDASNNIYLLKCKLEKTLFVMQFWAAGNNTSPGALIFYVRP